VPDHSGVEDLLTELPQGPRVLRRLALALGRAALEKQSAAGVPRELVGVVLEDKGVLRHGQRVVTPSGDGEILSGIFSPTLGKAIGFARVPTGAREGLRVDIRGRELPLRVVKYPFVRDGKSCI